MTGFKKRNTVQNVWERLSENLDFESSYFIRGSAKAAVRGSSGKQQIHRKTPVVEVYYNKVPGLKPVPLLQ